MLNIYIPKRPELIDYGLSEKEIPAIESFVITPKREAKSRDDKLGKISEMLALLIIGCVYLGGMIRSDEEYKVVQWATVLSVVFVFLFILKFIGIAFFISMPVYWLLELIIPKVLIHDSEALYDDGNMQMKKKKECLIKYQTDLEKWNKTIDELKKKYPHVDYYIPPGDHYVSKEIEYIKWCLEYKFLPEFRRMVKMADILEKEKHQEKWWRNLEPYRFENEICEWYKSRGYVAETTQQSGDGGVDVILKKDGEITYVQCKRFNSKVGVQIVRELYGVMALDNVSKGVIVCLDGLTTEAETFAKRAGINIITLTDLIIKQYGPTEYLPQEIKEKGLLYGDYCIMYEAWNNLEGALESIKKYNRREGYAYGLFRCFGFLLSVYASLPKLTMLSDDALMRYVIDANSFKVVYERNINDYYETNNSYNGNKYYKKRHYKYRRL